MSSEYRLTRRVQFYETDSGRHRPLQLVLPLHGRGRARAVASRPASASHPVAPGSGFPAWRPRSTSRGRCSSRTSSRSICHHRGDRRRRRFATGRREPGRDSKSPPGASRSACVRKVPGQPMKAIGPDPSRDRQTLPGCLPPAGAGDDDRRGRPAGRVNGRPRSSRLGHQAARLVGPARGRSTAPTPSTHGSSRLSRASASRSSICPAGPGPGRCRSPPRRSWSPTRSPPTLGYRPDRAPEHRYTRYNQTSSTTGHPLRWLDTNESWQWALDCWKAVFRAARVGRRPTASSSPSRSDRSSGSGPRSRPAPRSAPTAFRPGAWEAKHGSRSSTSWARRSSAAPRPTRSASRRSPVDRRGAAHVSAGGERRPGADRRGRARGEHPGDPTNGSRRPGGHG